MSEHATRKNITVGHVLKVLNRMLETDPVATRELILRHIPCNEALSKDPTIQVRSYKIQDDDPAYSVGLLGILNGLFGIDEGGWGPITANINLVCTEGCEIPDGRPLVIGGQCPICRDKGKPTDELGMIIFGQIREFVRTLPPEKRRQGPASG